MSKESTLSKDESELLTYIKSMEDGVVNADLDKKFPAITGQERLDCLNQLLQKGLIIVSRRKNTLTYKAINMKKVPSLSGDADVEEKVIYGIIAAAGNKGIWIRDIRQDSNLNMTMVNKIVKSLESKKLIKAIKLVNANKKKVYMLYNLEPDRSLSGGPWYQDQDFESEFVSVLHQQCLRFLRQKLEAARKESDNPLTMHHASCCTLTEVHSYIKELGISKVALVEKDLEAILMTLVYDGLAERIKQEEDVISFRALNVSVEKPGILYSPCGLCPLINECSINGFFTPTNCQYINEWIDKQVENNN